MIDFVSRQEIHIDEEDRGIAFQLRRAPKPISMECGTFELQVFSKVVKLESLQLSDEGLEDYVVEMMLKNGEDLGSIVRGCDEGARPAMIDKITNDIAEQTRRGPANHAVVNSEDEQRALSVLERTQNSMKLHCVGSSILRGKMIISYQGVKSHQIDGCPIIVYKGEKMTFITYTMERYVKYFDLP